LDSPAFDLDLKVSKLYMERLRFEWPHIGNMYIERSVATSIFLFALDDTSSTSLPNILIYFYCLIFMSSLLYLKYLIIIFISIFNIDIIMMSPPIPFFTKYLLYFYYLTFIYLFCSSSLYVLVKLYNYLCIYYQYNEWSHLHFFP
jgi:hypothetical protein